MNFGVLKLPIAAAIIGLAGMNAAVAEESLFCGQPDLDGAIAKPSGTVRFATFNASLNRNNEGDLVTALSNPGDSQARAVADIIQKANPDVILINEFDYDENGIAAELFQDNYLSLGDQPVSYPYRYVAESNTGIPSGFDLDNNDSVGGPGDAFGFGFFKGQFGMLILSKYPILDKKVRTFQKFLWKDMPGALLPDNPETPDPADWYSEEELEAVRLSSKSHWDIPVLINRSVVHVLASHPTPPVFDGPEDRNGTRNHDEIRFWADYVGGRAQSQYIVDDNNKKGGLKPNAAFVIMGDLNADPMDGDSTNNAALQLLEHPSVDTDVTPGSLGAMQASARQGQINDAHMGSSIFDTADFADGAPGNLRVDYVLPSKAGLTPTCGGVFWPRAEEQAFALTGDFPFASSDHRMVWVDMEVNRYRYFR